MLSSVRLFLGWPKAYIRYWWSTWVYGVTAGLNPALLQALIGAEKVSWHNVQPSALFLIETEEPRARESEDITTWLALKKSYQELAQQEHSEHLVLAIANTAVLEKTMCKVAESLQSIIP
jgi:TusA-related sulfurtransferase